MGGIAFKTVYTYTRFQQAQTKGLALWKQWLIFTAMWRLDNFPLCSFLVLSSIQHFTSTSSKVQLICACVVLLPVFNAKYCLSQLHTLSSVCLLSSTHIYFCTNTHTHTHTRIITIFICTHTGMKILSQCCLLTKFHRKHCMKAVRARNLTPVPYPS